MSLNIYVHGNCQATAIAALLREAFGREASVVAREVFSIDLEQGAAEIAHLVQSADVVVSQPIGDGYRGVEFLSTAWIANNIKIGARLLKVPVIYDRTHLPQCFPLAALYEGRLAYHDAHALEYFLRGASVDEFLHDTERSDFLPPGFVLSEALHSLREMLTRERDAEVDVQVSDSLADALAVRQPMLSVNHPDRSLLVETTNRLLAKMGRPETVAVVGEPMLDHFVVSPYLSTALGLGHDGSGMDFDRVRHEACWEGRNEYFKEIFSVYKFLGKERVGAACAGHDNLAAYLNRFRKFSSDKTKDPRLMIEGMYKGFFGRMPETKEVLYHLQVLKRAGFEVLLGQFLTFVKVHGG